MSSNRQVNLPTHANHTASYCATADGYNLYCSRDFGAPCIAIVVGDAGTLKIQLVDDSYVTLPEISDGFVWNVQAQAVLVEDAASSASEVVCFWNRIVDPSARGSLQLPADSYSLDGYGDGYDVEFHIQTWNADEAFLYVDGYADGTNPDGYVGEFTLDTDGVGVYTWTGIAELDAADWYAKLIDDKGRSSNTSTRKITAKFS